jgi:PAS domain S-box-containing protein
MAKSKSNDDRHAARLREAEGIIEALHRKEVDAIVADSGVVLLRLEKAERALHESEDQFRLLTETATDAILGLDEHGKVTIWNKSATRMFGYEAGEAIGYNLHKLIVPRRHHSKAGKGLKAFAKSGQGPLIGTVTVTDALHKDGTEFPVEISISSFQKEGAWHATAIIRDITERKQAEEKLRNLEAELRNTFNISPGLICVANANTGCFTECNQAVTRILGISVEEFTSRPFMELVHPDDRQRTRDEIIRQLKGASIANFENRYRCKDGSYKWLAWQATAADVNGKVYAVATDITERKQTEQNLLTSKLEIEQKNAIANIFLANPGDEMYGEVLQIVMKFLDSKFGVFGYLDEDGSFVVPSMTRGIWDVCHAPEKDIIFPRETWGDSSWPRAIREQKANYTNKLSQKTPEGHIPMLRHISLPIVYQGQVIGLFQVANKETDYDDQDVQTLQNIADYVSPILHARLQRTAEENARKQAEVSLQDSEQQIRLLLDSTAEAIYGLDLDGHCTLANAACLRMLGYDDISELIGRNMHELIHHSWRTGRSTL